MGPERLQEVGSYLTLEKMEKMIRAFAMPAEDFPPPSIPQGFSGYFSKSAGVLERLVNLWRFHKNGTGNGKWFKIIINKSSDASTNLRFDFCGRLISSRAAGLRLGILIPHESFCSSVTFMRIYLIRAPLRTHPFNIWHLDILEVLIWSSKVYRTFLFSFLFFRFPLLLSSIFLYICYGFQIRYDVDAFLAQTC